MLLLRLDEGEEGAVIGAFPGVGEVRFGAGVVVGELLFGVEWVGAIGVDGFFEVGAAALGAASPFPS